jgi:hypothetical protein
MKLMLASFAVGMVAMLLFESTITRVVGMTALTVFMVSGLFAIVAPELLDGDDD